MSVVIKEFFDTQYPKNGYSSFRVSVRGIIFKEDKIGLLKIESEDIFGKRNHFEVCGGGIENDESKVLALKREILEETGIIVNNLIYIGAIIDRWNLLSRINMHHYYTCDFVSQAADVSHSYEQEIKGIEWKSVDEFIKVLNKPVLKINKMIHERELIVLNKIKKSRII